MFSPGDAVGEYVIEQRLGGGGFGEVFLATEPSLKRQVALKFVRAQYAADPVFVQRFEREVTAMAAVEHPNVVPIYAHGRVRGLQYFAMRYVPGGSLDAFLNERHPALEDVVDLLAGVAEGLDHCHAQGIVHRDLKPANVLIDVAGRRALLADFGIADAQDATTLTRPGHVPGTPAYMAPETLMGARATAASDIWALAAVAYRAATNTLPRGAQQPPDSAPVPPSAHNHRFGPGVDEVFLRALSPEPARRHDSASAFIADLREALERPHHQTRRLRRAPAADVPTPALPRGLGARRVWSVAGAAIVLMPALAYGVSSLGEGDGSGRDPATPTDCHPSYTGACLKPDSVDYDCRGGTGDGPDYIGSQVRVVGSDPYQLDANGDGKAC